MTTPPIPDETLIETVASYRAHFDNQTAAANSLGIARETLQNRLRRAAERGLMGPKETLPGYVIAQITETPSGTFVRQKKEHGEEWRPTDGLAIKGKTSLIDAEGRIITQHVMERAGAADTLAAMRAAVDAFKEELPRLPALAGPVHAASDLLNQFVVTDNHFGMLSWKEETGSDYDLKIAEQLLLDWFAHEIATAPEANTAVLAQLGDLMHHDALESVTPAHKHVLDADSRLQKIIRIVIRTIRRIIDMLLLKHQFVHVVMASGNHDPASSAWLREMLAAMYENEPRIFVDNSPMLYYAKEWGDTALFYHHGHKAGMKNVDVKFVSVFRDLYGKTKYAYGHTGHKHADEGVKTTLMYLEQHETLAGPDAFGASGPWWSGRSAKRITYSKRFGEVGRSTARPEMVLGSYALAANDNSTAEEKAA